MRLLFAIPHYFKPMEPDATNRSQRPEAKLERARALTAVVGSLHQAFGTEIYGLDHIGARSWQVAAEARDRIDIVICTTGDDHLLSETPSLHPLYRHHATMCEASMLGFECHRLLSASRGAYDYYAYLEDDIVLTDPLFFRKRRLFDRLFGPDALLQPNRYEARLDGPIHKLYVDYRIRLGLTAPYQDITQEPRLHMPFIDETILFERTPYPSAGSFFLNAEQLERWISGPHFLDGDVSYMGPLDSAATLSVMKTFRIYKPVLDQAWFLEVLHASPRWIAAAPQITRLTPRPLAFAPVAFEDRRKGE